MLIIEDVCPAIIDKEIFMEAQEKMQMRKRRKGANRAKREYLLSGLIICEHCGQAMTGDTSKNKYGKEYRYYRCPKKTRLGTNVCPNKSISADKLEDLVISQIQELFLDEDTLDQLMDKVEISYKKMVENTDAELAELKKKLAAIDRKIDKFYDFVCDGGNVDDRARERYRAMKEEYSNYSKQIEKKEAVRPASISRATIRKYIERYRKEMATGKAPNIAGTIAAFVDKIKVSDSNITIGYRFTPVDDRLEKLESAGALGGSRTHAFSSGG
ncbi:recombinase zinc beta ribbon domain-containing protein [Anaerovibrio lipolyticus]|nr:recombinase zinc beta ribbon domain-containing protein [Anaerovibrio lipolyticus]